MNEMAFTAPADRILVQHGDFELAAEYARLADNPAAVV